MSCSAAAQLLSVTLYYRRFFPYYAFCMIGGIDEDGEGSCCVVMVVDKTRSYSFDFLVRIGKGAVYGYDAVGSFKRDDYGCMGSGQNFIMPILDNLIGHKNRQDEKKPLSAEEVVCIVKDIFIIATERDIYTGDSVEIKLVTKDSIKTEIFPLKTD